MKGEPKWILKHVNSSALYKRGLMLINDACDVLVINGDPMTITMNLISHEFLSSFIRKLHTSCLSYLIYRGMYCSARRLISPLINRQLCC